MAALIKAGIRCADVDFHCRFRPADPETPEVAGNPRTASSYTTYQPVILANAGIQTIGESDDQDEDSRQALGSSECGAPSVGDLSLAKQRQVTRPPGGTGNGVQRREAGSRLLSLE
jgi:hypothetical protein